MSLSIYISSQCHSTLGPIPKFSEAHKTKKKVWGKQARSPKWGRRGTCTPPPPPPRIHIATANPLQSSILKLTLLREKIIRLCHFHFHRQWIRTVSSNESIVAPTKCSLNHMSAGEGSHGSSQRQQCTALFISAPNTLNARLEKLINVK